ncbi:uncharacterized protein LOC110710581 [Chenopodium quinoa]|uniref:Uncharacterized protein n=1 Tax=Chenopodium quinoa TaxID=63459 RepID=A0A803MJD3_CHEQI|nr:uncharacterized protein LOC110710581 [Chenopodium quinoa]
MADLITAEEVRLVNPEADYETLKAELDAKVNTAEGNVELSADQVLLNTQFLNLCPDKIQRIDRRFWSGSVVTDRPTLSSGYYTVLTQKGTKPEGVKWGQVWANGTADDTTARKWIVAFDTAAGKAYAEAGPMGPVDWNVIEVRLGLSGSKTEHTDPILGGNVLATIDGLKAYAHFR